MKTAFLLESNKLVIFFMIVLFYRISVVKCILYYTDFTAAKHGNSVEFALSANSINNNIK